jgi:hypothetical protein
MKRGAFLIAELRRATDPTELPFGDDGCGVCLVPFQAEAVQVLVSTEDTPYPKTPICPSCIEYLGMRNPKEYPTIEEYEELKKRYPDPIFDHEPPEEIWDAFYGEKAHIDRKTLTHDW